MRVWYGTLLSVFLLAGCSQTESVDKPVHSKSNPQAVKRLVVINKDVDHQIDDPKVLKDLSIEEKRLHPSDPRQPSELGNQYIPNATETLHEIIPPRPTGKEPRYTFIQ
ncbi:hypothetical protein [Ammoniphilus sp. 3BR4]|uniref:hypothetical protein n=1 Tax=Ammoniphilus sp. 3BR4 TaxID=3158265 RepID=UPI003466DCAC